MLGMWPKKILQGPFPKFCYVPYLNVGIIWFARFLNVQNGRCFLFLGFGLFQMKGDIYVTRWDSEVGVFG